MLQASSKVKGITIEIGADTTSFGFAMKQIKQDAALVAKDMKAVDEAMKLDPNNIEKAADKLKLLREASDTAARKIEAIKKAIEQLNKEYADKSSDEYRKQLDFLTRSLESASREQEIANARLKDFETNAKGAEAAGLSLGDIIKANLTSDLVLKGLSKFADFAKTIARELIKAGKELWNFSKESVSVAAQYEDAIGYSQKLFGSQAGNLSEWVKENSAALRISISDLQVYANNLGTAFNALGLKRNDAISFTKDILSLSADIRAATGKDIEEINAALTRGFTSSLRNFRQFGLYISEADVKIQAIKDGVIEYTGNQDELTAAMIRSTLATENFEKAMDLYEEGTEEYATAEEKAQEATEALNALLGNQEVELTSAERATALYNLVMEKFSFLIGQNERESGLYNSQIAEMKTNFSNLKLQIGQELLPVFTELLTKFNEFLKSDEGQEILNKIVEAFKTWADTIKGMMDDGRMSQFINDLIEKLPTIVTDIQNIVNKVIELAPKVAEVAGDFLNIAHATANPGQYIGSGIGWENTGRTSYGRAGGGPAEAGQLLRVNDDAGHRTEMFIPSVPGMILNGDKTDKIINNTNNSRTVGDVNVYLTATSNNASAIADQIGAEVHKRLRMSGAYLY